MPAIRPWLGPAVFLVFFAGSCVGGGETDGPDPYSANCSIAGTLFDDHDAVVPPRSDLAVGSPLGPDGRPTGPGLPDSLLRRSRSFKSVVCADTSSLAGSVTFRLAGLLGLGAEGTRAAARAFTLDSVEVVRVQDVGSLDPTPDVAYLWEGIRVLGFSFDASRVSGLSGGAAVNRLRNSIDVSVSAGGGSNERVSLVGQSLYVGWRAVRFQLDSVTVVAERSLAAARQTTNFVLDRYTIDFSRRASGDWLMTVSDLSMEEPREFDVPSTLGSRSFRLRRQQVSGGIEVDDLVVTGLDLRSLEVDPRSGGIVGTFRVRRQHIGFGPFRVDTRPGTTDGS